MQLLALLFDAMGFDERRLVLDQLDLRDIQALACTQSSFFSKLTPTLLDLFADDQNAYTWAGRSLTLPAPRHGGVSLRMGVPTAERLTWTCRITEHRASKVPNQWVAFGLEHVDDSGWHMHLVSDRGCVYADGRLQVGLNDKLPKLKADDELIFFLDLSGRGTLAVQVNRGPILTLTCRLVAGRARAVDRIEELYARAHIWDSAVMKSRTAMPRTEQSALGPHCAVRFLPGPEGADEGE